MFDLWMEPRNAFWGKVGRRNGRNALGGNIEHKCDAGCGVAGLLNGIQKQLRGKDADGNPKYALIPARMPSVGYLNDPDGLNYDSGPGHLYLQWTDNQGQLQRRYYDGDGERSDGSGWNESSNDALWERVA